MIKTNLQTCSLKHLLDFLSVVSLGLLQACFPNHSCLPCAEKIQEHAGEALRFVGGIGLFFSFTEVSVSSSTAEGCERLNMSISQEHYFGLRSGGAK